MGSFELNTNTNSLVSSFLSPMQPRGDQTDFSTLLPPKPKYENNSQENEDMSQNSEIEPTQRIILDTSQSSQEQELDVPPSPPVLAPQFSQPSHPPIRRSSSLQRSQSLINPSQ